MLNVTASVWEIVSAVSTAVGTLFVIATVFFTAIFGRRQLREALATRHLQSGVVLFEQMERGSVLAARWLLYHHGTKIDELLSGEDGLSKLDDFLASMPLGQDGPTSVLQLRNELVTLEYAAAFSLLELIPTELERTYVSPILHRTWLNAKCFAKATREELKTDVYLQHCEAVYDLVESGKAYSDDMKIVKQAKKAKMQRLIRQSRLPKDEGFGPTPRTGVPA
jgi:hypothetical protein